MPSISGNMVTIESGDYAMERVVREQMKKWKPDVSEAEIHTATEKVLASGGESYATAKGIRVGQQFDLSAALPPQAKPAATAAPLPLAEQAPQPNNPNDFLALLQQNFGINMTQEQLNQLFGNGGNQFNGAGSQFQGITLDDIGRFSVPGNFNDSLGLGVPFNQIVGRLSGSGLIPTLSFDFGVDG